MEFTGERVIPGQTDPDLFNEHVARYRFAESLASGQRVLDLGCGVAYGSALLAPKAEQVYALDSSFDALASGRASHSNLRFVQGDGAALPLLDNSIDIVVAFEVIEHLERWAEMLAEAARVLKTDGQLLVSTPNRVYYHASRSAPNPFHVHEFDFAEFEAALKKEFRSVRIFFENHTNAITFAPKNVQGVRTLLEDSNSEAGRANFFLAVCSQTSQYGSPAFLYVPKAGNVLQEREQHIEMVTADLEKVKGELSKLTASSEAAQKKARQDFENLEAEFNERTEWAKKVQADYERAVESFAALEADHVPKAGNVLQEREQHIEMVTADLEKVKGELSKLTASSEAAQKKARAEIAELQAEIEEKNRWALEVDRAAEKTRQDFENLEAEFNERTEWAKKVQADYERAVESFAALEADHQERLAEISTAAGKIDELEQRVIERSEWAQSLDREIAELRTQLDAFYASPAYKIGRRLRLAPQWRPTSGSGQ